MDTRQDFLRFIKGYKRVALACDDNQPRVESDNLQVWVNSDGVWSQLPESDKAKMFDKRLQGSLCGILFDNIFGLDKKHYNSFKHSLQGQTTVGVNGLYVSKSEPHAYAIVVQLPKNYNRQRLTAGAIGAGISTASNIASMKFLQSVVNKSSGQTACSILDPLCVTHNVNKMERLWSQFESAYKNAKYFERNHYAFLQELDSKDNKSEFLREQARLLERGKLPKLVMYLNEHLATLPTHRVHL
jgi:hypothetical protein